MRDLYTASFVAIATIVIVCLMYSIMVTGG